MCKYCDSKDGACTNINHCEYKIYEFGANEDFDYVFCHKLCDKEGEEELEH